MTDSPIHDPFARGFTRATPLYRLMQTLCEVAMRIFYDFKSYGRENVPKQGGVLLASNHESYLDPILVSLLLTRPLSFFARSSLFKGGFGKLIRMLGAFPVRQGEGDVGAVKEAIRRLKEGRMLNLYPEGGRSRTGQLEEFQPGFALIVRRAGVPVVPVAIDGSYEAWPHSRKLPGPGKLRVMYGKPLDVSGMSAAEIVKLLEERIRLLVAELELRSRTE